MDDREPSTFKPLGSYVSPAPLVCIKWLTEQAVLAIDTKDNIHIIDVRAMTLCEVSDISKVQLVSSAHFARISGLPESLRSYEPCITALHGNVYLLGKETVLLVNLLKYVF
jgi:hypothetical protein